MNFLTMLAIIFYGGTVLVCADFWIEFRAQTSSSSTGQGRSAAANYLYQCEGIPAGISGFEANESKCRQVTSYAERVHIYMTCNFYSVHNPRLQGQTIHFSNHRRAHSEVIWYVGYKNKDMDHPNCAPPLRGDVEDFRAKVEQMGFVVTQTIAHFLAEFLAQTNMIKFSEVSDRLDTCLGVYKTVLARITHWYAVFGYHDDAEQLREQFGTTMKVLLEKMIDPCTVLSDDDQAAQYCRTNCAFLNTAAQHCGRISNRCSCLEGGVCISEVCTCSVRGTHPFAGCQNTPMQLCNNELRKRLNLFQP